MEQLFSSTKQNRELKELLEYGTVLLHLAHILHLALEADVDYNYLQSVASKKQCTFLGVGRFLPGVWILRRTNKEFAVITKSFLP